MSGVTEQALWSLDELVQRVGAALAGPAYRGAPNGRVREVPDRRAVRWYTTTGLVDRPVMQGRTAQYGTRHLHQIVAVKRRQAEGRSLAEIQAELTGATDETLRRVAAVPDDVIDAAPPQPAPARRTRFWAEPPAAQTPPNGADTVTRLPAVSLPGGAVLLLPANADSDGRPDAADIHAIQAAAQPLLELLAERGLLSHDDLSHDERRPQ